MLRPSSIPHEYYFGDMPGTLQYKKKVTDILSLELPNDEEKGGFNICEQSLENLNCIIPVTQLKIKWKIILMMKMIKNDDEVHLKAALQNQSTGEIALLTSINKNEYFEREKKRKVKTLSGSWFVGHFRMSAPVVFWRELQNRLKY
jgi:hypothetical protein